tara:strand:- start:10436 stop:11698 length:1263 start_codon:yes stop_codon:yes gene_type:complete
MNNIQDLNIKDEVLPIFDYSLNMFAKAKILEILHTPLNSVEDILYRQNILRAFAKNNNVLKKYSYTVLYLNEVHFFLNDTVLVDLRESKIKYRFFTPRREKSILSGKLNQLIIFFHRLQTFYFTRLSLEPFPEPFKDKIKEIVSFLSQFQLEKYEHLIREHRLKDSHIIALTHILVDQKEKKRIAVFWENLFLFEAYLSINQGILNNNFVFPSFSEDGIKISELFHPLLDNPIKNDFETSSNVIVLNGPNMSGKSTFLKAIGLCLYLGHLGLGIPASIGQLPFVTNFSIEINRRDDILNGYSHFMTEIVNLKKVVEHACNGNRCFAIFDELFSGTNLEDALEICRTTIQGLSKFKNSYFFISTHIQELENTSNDSISTYYIDCELLNERPTFTYKLKKGWSNIKVGRILFEKEGLNKLLN